MPETTEEFAVSDEELELSFETPSTYSNRYLVTWGPQGLRIAFGEQSKPGQPTHYRTAVALTTSDAKLLNQLLQKAIDEITTAKPSEDS